VVNRIVNEAPRGAFPFRDAENNGVDNGCNTGRSRGAGGYNTGDRRNARIKGREGEEAAARALEKAGMNVLFRNFRSGEGEIDLIARDGESLVFVEVKSWPAFGLENLDYGISGKKKSRIIKTAKYFLSIHREYIDRPVRFDVVYLSPREGACIRFEAAFMEIQ
jgi:putative endonuclease